MPRLALCSFFCRQAFVPWRAARPSGTVPLLVLPPAAVLHLAVRGRGQRHGQDCLYNPTRSRSIRSALRAESRLVLPSRNNEFYAVDGCSMFDNTKTVIIIASKSVETKVGL